MSLPSVTSTPTQTTVDLGNGFKSVTSTILNSNGLPSSVSTDSYQNGTLTDVSSQTFTYANGVETVNWSDVNKQFNTSTSGSYTIQLPFQNL